MFDVANVVSVSVPANHGIPNNPNLAALIYPCAVAAGSSSEQIMQLYARNRWGRSWVYGVFDFHHFHYAAHEVLTVIRGKARLQLGGADGSCHDVAEGDVIILPAGFGHKLVNSAQGFTVVGGYPRGQEDTGYVRAGEGTATEVERVIATPLPERDPVFGTGGPLGRLWGMN